MSPLPLTLIMFLPVVVFAGVATMFSLSGTWVKSAKETAKSAMALRLKLEGLK